MSIRAAYGVFSDFTSLDTYNFYATEPPFGNSASATFPSNLANPWQSTPGGHPFPLPAVSKNSLYVLNGTYENVPLHFKPPVAHQWNLTIQRQLGTDWLVQANYIGNGYRHLPGSDQDDPGVYIPGSCVINGVTTNPCSTIANVNFTGNWNYSIRASARAAGCRSQGQRLAPITLDRGDTYNPASRAPPCWLLAWPAALGAAPSLPSRMPPRSQPGTTATCARWMSPLFSGRGRDER